MLGYPIAGADGDVRPGHRRFNIVWYLRAEAEKELKRLMADETGRHYPLGIPPGLIQAEVVAELRAAAHSNLAPQFCKMVELVETPFFQSVADMDVPSMIAGRVSLLGDAPFVVRPHCGMGVTKAAGNAVLLADLLAAFPGDIDHALRVYDEERCRYGQYLTAHSRRLGSQMKQSYTSDEERREAEYYRRPATSNSEAAMIMPPATYCQGAGINSTGHRIPSATPSATSTRAISGGGAMALEESLFDLPMGNVPMLWR